MPGPFSVLSKVQKGEIAKQMDEVVVIDGREIRKGDMLEFEIEKYLRAGKGTEDIMKSLRKQGMDVPSAYVKERMAVARGRKPIEGDRGYDKKYARMELNFIIERGLANGQSWDDIGKAVGEAFPKAHVDKIIEGAKNQRAKIIQQASPPAVIDNGESGPMAPEDQPPVFDAEADARAKNRQVLDDSKKTDEDWQNEFKDIATKAGRLRAQAQKDLRGKSEAEIAASPWMIEMEGLVRSLRDSIIPTGARVMESVDPTNANSAPQNLDVPVAPAGINGPVEPEFRNQ